MGGNQEHTNFTVVSEFGDKTWEQYGEIALYSFWIFGFDNGRGSEAWYKWIC